VKGKLSMSALICFIIAALFIVGDIAAIRSAADYSSNSVTVQGVVTGYERAQGSSRGRASYRYTVQYKASDVQVYEMITTSGSH